MLPDEGMAATWLRGHDVGVVVEHAPAALLRFGGSWRRHLLSTLLALPAYWWRAARVLRGYDVVHINDLRGLLLVGPSAVLARRPWLVHVHNGEVGGRAWKLLVRPLLAARVPLVVASRRGARGWGGAAVGRLHEVPCQARTRARSPEAPVPTVVTLARLHPAKGLGVLLEAVRMVQQRGLDVETLVVGPDSPGHEVLAEDLRCLGAGIPGVRFLGLLDEPWEVASTGWVYAQPSFDEPFGMGALEAAAAGLPAVASDVGGLRDVVDDGVTGVLVPPGDALALADALERLLRDADLRARLGAAGQRRVAAQFGPELFVERIAGVYADLGAR